VVHPDGARPGSVIVGEGDPYVEVVEVALDVLCGLGPQRSSLLRSPRLNHRAVVYQFHLGNAFAPAFHLATQLHRASWAKDASLDLSVAEEVKETGKETNSPSRVNWSAASFGTSHIHMC
jgi:hypothetical protein